MSDNAARIVRIDRKTGIALDTNTTADTSHSAEVQGLKASLRLYEKGWVEGYAQALLNTGVTARSPEHRDEMLKRYRETAAKRFSEKRGAA